MIAQVSSKLPLLHSFICSQCSDLKQVLVFYEVPKLIPTLITPLCQLMYWMGVTSNDTKTILSRKCSAQCGESKSAWVCILLLPSLGGLCVLTASRMFKNTHNVFSHWPALRYVNALRYVFPSTYAAPLRAERPFRTIVAAFADMFQGIINPLTPW